jgi:hypothetical protein
MNISGLEENKMPQFSPPAAYVAKKMIAAYPGRLHDQSLCLLTPIPKLVPLSELTMRPALRD